MSAKSLRVLSGNRLELLALDLSERLGSGRGVFKRETVVVPNMGSARWLVSFLANRDGICSNIEFSLPKGFITERLCRIDAEKLASASPELLRWRIFEALPELIARQPEDFAAPAAYIESGASGSKLKTWQLACRLADCFDQYITLRPDMIADWEARPEAFEPPAVFGKRTPSWSEHWRWQRALWLELMAGRPHLPGEFKRILDGALAGRELPERVFLFGFSTMPPVYLEIFAELARHRETVLHYLNPCQAYWAEIKPERERLKEMGKFEPERWCDAHIDEANELLASFAKPSREFFARLVASSDRFLIDESFVDPFEDGPPSALRLLQRGVCLLAPASELAADAKEFRVGPDRSVRIHSCHSRMREVEVLRDEILELLDKHSGEGVENPLRPSDIIVMAPDISEYAPFVRAAFGGDRRGSLRLDFSLSDQSLGASTPEASAFLAILKMPRGRFSAEEILAPLDCESVRDKLGLSSEDIAWLRAKLRAAGASWGVDAEGRRKSMERDGVAGAPLFEEGSWRFALERVLLGHALEPAGTLKDAFSVDGRPILPLPLSEGDGARAAGAFAGYFEKLAAFADAVDGERTAEGWRVLLLSLFDGFLLPEWREADDALAVLNNVVALLSDAKTALRPDTMIPYDAMLSAVEDALGSKSSGGAFLRGGVTFCRMQPLRNIPARVVCLLGMNDREFPRPDKERGFDLLREGRRLCDRSPRDDDRQLFLDALLSARDAFRVFYVGQDSKDNSPIPTSPAVEELCEHLKAVFGPDSLAKFRVRHPLHPFSPKYFSPEARAAWAGRARPGDSWSFDLFSYSYPDLAASKAFAFRKGAKSVPWAASFEPLPPPELFKGPLVEMDVDALAARLLKLPENFLQERLGLRLKEREDAPLPEDELEGDSLDAYMLDDALLDALLENPALSIKDAYRFHRAGGDLIPGAVGYLRFEKVFEKLSSFAESLRAALGSRKPRLKGRIAISASEFPSAKELAATLPDVPPGLEARLEFSTGALFENGLAFRRPATLKAKDVLGAWLRHLAFNALEEGPARETRRSSLYGMAAGAPERLVFAPLAPPEARRQLAWLLCLAVEG